MSEWKVLVPVEVLEGETVPETVVDLLGVLPVVVLGYHVLPEQTAPGQARLQFEEQAQKKLDDLAESFDEAGASAETRLVFTHDEEQTLDRVADETGCGAILIPNPAPDIERVLVPLRGDVDVDRIVTFLAALLGERDVGVTLYHVGESEAEGAPGRELLDAASDRLQELGVPSTAIETASDVSDSPLQAITTAALDHDAVVMGERAPSLRALLFGEESEQVAERSLGPVIVVRRVPEPPGESVAPDDAE
jgi:nucleotide-binding universal stress UspA family protein